MFGKSVYLQLRSAVPMSDESYSKCRTCRFCAHADSGWICHFTGEDNGADGTCNRYRPGICESCNFYHAENGKEMCGLNSLETFGLDVCTMYDPGYSV